MYVEFIQLTLSNYLSCPIANMLSNSGTYVILLALESQMMVVLREYHVLSRVTMKRTLLITMIVCCLSLRCAYDVTLAAVESFNGNVQGCTWLCIGLCGWSSGNCSLEPLLSVSWLIGKDEITFVVAMTARNSKSYIWEWQ